MTLSDILLGRLIIDDLTLCMGMSVGVRERLRALGCCRSDTGLTSGLGKMTS